MIYLLALEMKVPLAFLLKLHVLKEILLILSLSVSMSLSLSLSLSLKWKMALNEESHVVG